MRLLPSNFEVLGLRKLTAGDVRLGLFLQAASSTGYAWKASKAFAMVASSIYRRNHDEHNSPPFSAIRAGCRYGCGTDRAGTGYRAHPPHGPATGAAQPGRLQLSSLPR